MSGMIKVGMADLKTGRDKDVLTTLGLGSCIGIAMYDKSTKIGGLAHIMLPDSTQIKNNTNIAKFADTGINELLNQMVKMGARKTSIVAKIAGGAKMFEMSGLSAIGNVGERNAESSKATLKKLGIKLVAEDTGLNYGRTVELYCDDGKFLIKAVGKDVKEI